MLSILINSLLTLCDVFPCRYDFEAAEEPLEERLGKYAREHLIIRDEQNDDPYGRLN